MKLIDFFLIIAQHQTEHYPLEDNQYKNKMLNLIYAVCL